MSTLAGIGLILIGLAIFASPYLQYRFAKLLEELKADYESEHQIQLAALERARLATVRNMNLTVLNAQLANQRALMDHAHKLNDDETWRDGK